MSSTYAAQFFITSATRSPAAHLQPGLQRAGQPLHALCQLGVAKLGSLTFDHSLLRRQAARGAKQGVGEVHRLGNGAASRRHRKRTAAGPLTGADVEFAPFEFSPIGFGRLAQR
jgi:hypothetical protein